MRPKKIFGQHFLKRADVLAQIAQHAAPGPNDLVLEVGPGPGNLTQHLLATGARVVAAEIDARFAAVTPVALGNPAQLRWWTGDVLASKNMLDPELVALLGSELMTRQRLLLVANLPYAIATPLLALLVASPLPLTTAVVTVQLEVAERMVAEPGSKDYGPISVMLRLAGSVRLLRRLGRHDFWPPPKVRSAIVELQLRGAAERAPLAAVGSVVRRLFPYRRKTLRAALIKGFAPAISAAVADRIGAQIGPAKRTETLTPNEFVALYEMLLQAGVGAGAGLQNDAARGAVPETPS